MVLDLCPALSLMLSWSLPSSCAPLRQPKCSTAVLRGRTGFHQAKQDLFFRAVMSLVVLCLCLDSRLCVLGTFTT